MIVAKLFFYLTFTLTTPIDMAFLLKLCEHYVLLYFRLQALKDFSFTL